MPKVFKKVYKLHKRINHFFTKEKFYKNIDSRILNTKVAIYGLNKQIEEYEAYINSEEYVNRTETVKKIANILDEYGYKRGDEKSLLNEKPILNICLK